MLPQKTGMPVKTDIVAKSQSAGEGLRVAILSPNKNVYSETFIQAHKTIPFDVRYYYGKFVPTHLEGKGPLITKFQSAFVPLAEKLLRRQVFCYSALEKSLAFEGIACAVAEFGTTGAESTGSLRRLGIPLVVFFHGYDASDKALTERYRDKYRAMFGYASTVFAVSSRMKKDLVALGCPEEKIVLNVYGPDPVFFNVERKAGKKQFVAVGRFVEKKAPQTTIRAFSKVVEQHPDASLVMGGTGPLLEACKQLVAELQLTNHVTFPGVLDRGQILELFSGSLAFVQHSVVAASGDSEGTPVAILEASAAGLPVVATVHAGIPDVIADGATGLLVEEHDMEGMAAAMIRLCDDPALAWELGANGSRRIRENFTLEKHLDTLSKAIREAVKIHAV